MTTFQRSMMIAATCFALLVATNRSADAQGYGFGSNVQSNGYYGGLSTLQHAPLHGGRPDAPVSPNPSTGRSYVYGGTYAYPSDGYGYNSYRPSYGYGYGVPVYGYGVPTYGYSVPTYGTGYGTGYGYGYGVQTYGTQLNIYPGGVIQGYSGRLNY